jgi:hypothetical protein
MIKNIGNTYRIYGLIIVKIEKKLLVLNYEFSNATFKPPNHAFTQPSIVTHNVLRNDCMLCYLR